MISTMKSKLPIQLSMVLKSFSAEDPGGWSEMFALARAADAAGVDRLVVSDHVVFGERLEEYGRPEVGGQAGGKQPTGPDGHWLEPLTTLSVVAGMTSKIRLGTNIIIAALRRPVILAKSAATLDVLSGGRLDLGVGVGWQKEEYDAAGLRFEGRGRLLDHTLEVCQTLWRERRAAYRSPELQFEAIHQMPKPLQPGGVPIWIAGTLRGSTISRLARFGAGWIPWGEDAANLPESLPRLKDALANLGRDASDLQVVGHLPLVKDAKGSLDISRTMAGLPELVESGVTDFRALFVTPSDAGAAEEHLRHIVSAFRAAVGRPAQS
jgi:probable F420-dependent oxidoreductase